MRPRLIALSLLRCGTNAAQADEGMWMPSQLPAIAKQLRQAGFQGDPAALAQLAQSPMGAVSASWMYDPRYKRASHVDMRYLRWLLAKVYPAPRLLKELNLPAR